MYLEFAELCQNIYSKYNFDENVYFIENQSTDCQCFMNKKDNDIIVCFRGTDSLIDILLDSMIFKVSFVLDNVMTDIPTLTPEKIITKITNKKTGEVYETEEALKAANIPEEDVQRDVTVIMPPLDLFAKTK